MALAGIVALEPSGCATRGASKLDDWSAGNVIPYRLVTKDDFRAKTSSSAWGNFAHGAEICTHIVPLADGDRNGSYQAVMNPDCSFWNKVAGPVGFLGRIVGLLLGIPVVVPVKQPDWYILQHEQIHFAIMEVAARKLSRQLAKLSRSHRNSDLIKGVYSMTLSHAYERHRAFDSETSGTFEPDQLEKWVRVLEAQMQELCGTEARCQVRNGGG